MKTTLRVGEIMGCEIVLATNTESKVLARERLRKAAAELHTLLVRATGADHPTEEGESHGERFSEIIEGP